ncbi:MAG: hypothetical protein U1E42_06750 [Rhodospirillales bacterium]
MMSGMQVLGSIDDIFGQARGQTMDADRKIEELKDRQLRLQREQTETYQALARIRLAAGEKDDLVARLTAVDENVRRVLGSRSEATVAIDGEISRIEAEAVRLRGARERAATAAGERQQALITCEAAARQRLEATAEYQSQQAAADAAEKVAAQARQKTEQAEGDRTRKGKPYEDDRLFQYLWRRGFGTSAYTGGALTRMLDRWVANTIGYDQARADYAMLQEIPERLTRHADRVAEEAAAETAKLSAMQQAALAEAEPAAARAELAKAEAAVDTLDDAIEANGKAQLQAIGRRALIVSGDDPQTQGAMRAIDGALRDQGLLALRTAAAVTQTDADDEAVRRLERIDEEGRQVAQALDDAVHARKELQERMAEIGSVRRDYRQRGYNRGMFDAAGGAFIGSLVGELLKGALSRDRFWDQVGSRQLPGPDGWGGGFGGGFGGFGGGDGGGGGGGGGDFGGSDFRTGGGF